MKPTTQAHNFSKVSAASLLITLGIIYGDIGTSPLYVMKAIFSEATINYHLVYGAISAIFWTLTLQTTLKYVYLTLRADNKGEGGIFALYTLIKKLNKKWLIIPAILGGSAMLADGIITPPISISSAIEGLQIYQPDIQTIPIVLFIIFLLFFFQSYGTSVIGKFFGPIMLLWFSMLGVLGFIQILYTPSILQALNPYYAYELLKLHPSGFYVLGFVFLCTTGAEALYSDLGHCGIKNIRISWIFVKTMLVLNYLGQGAFLLQENITTIKTVIAGKETVLNPFYMMMPKAFLPIGIAIATAAAIIAAQALISGSFTMINEAIRLNLWPKVKIKYPSIIRGQLYIPSINWLLFAGCVWVVLHFEESNKMEAAYGLAIILCMLSTSTLLVYYMIIKRFPKIVIGAFLLIYSILEISFLIANLDKFHHGGYVSLIVAGVIAVVMSSWFYAKKLRKNYTNFTKINPYLGTLTDLSKDSSISTYATNLVYLTNAHKKNEIESKIMYSILQKRPKKANYYWFLHVHVMNEPHIKEYMVTRYSDEVIRVDFYLGFRINHIINAMFREVVQDMISKGEIDGRSAYDSLKSHNVPGDYKYVLIEKKMTHDAVLPWYEKATLELYQLLRKWSLTEEKAFGLDNSSVKIEYYPFLTPEHVTKSTLKRRDL